MKMSIRAFAGVLIAVAFPLVPIAGAAAVPVTGIAYDEVTKIIIGGGTPEPGTFAADFDSAVNTQKSVAAPGAHRGLLGGIMNTMDTAKNAVGMLKSGTASSKYYLKGWERSDDPGAQTAVIDKPSLHQIIYLNLAKKTYRLVDTSVQSPSEPTPVERPRGGAGRPSQPSQPAQPGTGKLDITVSTTSLGPRAIENVPTTGYRLTFGLVETQSTGSCSDGNFQTAMSEYVSNYAQPHLRVSPVTMGRPMAMSGARPEMSALPAGCVPTTTMHTAVGTQPPSDHLVMWMLMVVNAGAPSAQGQMSGGFSTLVERGNVRALGASDLSLFDIPADFTKEV